MQPKKFVIISYGRTGSTYLCNALDACNNVRCFHEVLRPTNNRSGKMFARAYQQQDDPLPYIEDNIWSDSTLPKVRGFKLFYGHCRAHAGFWQALLTDPTITCIHLSRHNLFLNFLSGERARATRLWHPNSENQAHYRKARAELHINCNDMLDTIQQKMARASQLRQHLAGRQLEISYEGLADGTDLERAREFLNAESGFYFEPFATSPLGPERVTISNLDDVAAALSSIGQSIWLEQYLENG